VEKVDLLIGGEQQIAPGTVGGRGFVHKGLFGYWSELDICLMLDGYSTVGFKAPFEVSRREFRDAFRPFSFLPLELQIQLRTIFKGTLVDVSPEVSADEKSVTVTGYAAPSVFEDCDMPASALPLEFKDQDLRSICEALAAPFGIEVEFLAQPGTPFKKVKVETDKKVQDFLNELTKQRNAVLSNTFDGKLLCWQSVEPGSPVCNFTQGVSPLSRVEATFEPREYFSEITGFGKKTRKLPSAKFTVKNPWLPTPLRPHTFKLDNTERGDVPEATNARLGRMFANMATFKISDIPTWRDPQGNLWQPNTTVTLLAPDAMVYRRTELLVRRVDLHQDKESESASLELVMPGAFSGKIPTVLPWDEP
jgi:prophage tail gpP-like protein